MKKKSLCSKILEANINHYSKKLDMFVTMNTNLRYTVNSLVNANDIVLIGKTEKRLHKLLDISVKESEKKKNLNRIFKKQWLYHTRSINLISA